MSKGVHNIAFYVSPDPECSRTTQNSEISLAPSRGRILYAIYGNSTCVINHIVVTAIDKKYRNYYVSTPRTAIVSRVKIQLTMEATHILESQGQPLSAGSKFSSPRKPLTNWRAKDSHCQQGQNPAHHGNHSQTGEPRTAIVSRVKIQLTMEATHKLESRGQPLSAGSKSSSPWKPLTHWRAKDSHCQQGQNPAHHGSHSLPGEPRTAVVSRVKIQLTMEATHFLESQGQALSAGSKSNSPWKPLTNWRAQALLAGSKSSSPWKPLTDWRAEARH